MEYNNCTTSDNFSDSESSSYTNELTNHENDERLKKIDKFKRKIIELENTSIMKEAKKSKTRKGSSNQNQTVTDKIIIEDEFFNSNKSTKLTINKIKRSSNKSQPPVSEEDTEEDTEFSSDEPKQVIIIQIRIYMGFF